VDKVFIQILNMSLTASYVIFFVLIARLLLKKAPKIFSYALWSVVFFRLLFPFSFESVFSLLFVKPVPIPVNISDMPLPQVDTGITVINSVVNPLLQTQGIAETVSVNPLQIWIFVGQCVWLLGIGVILLYSVISLIRLRLRLVGAVRWKKNIYLADNIPSPFVIGTIQPKIYMPSTLRKNEWNYILLHEKTHIRRLDHIWKIIAFLALSVHWFNPLVWISYVLFVRDMEMSCDERVMKSMDIDVRKKYSESLLKMAAGRRKKLGIALAFGENETKRRIKNVLNYKKPALWVVVIAVIVVGIIVVALAVNPHTSIPGIKDIVPKTSETSKNETETSPSNSIESTVPEMEWKEDEGVVVSWLSPNESIMLEVLLQKEKLNISFTDMEDNRQIITYEWPFALDTDYRIFWSNDSRYVAVGSLDGAERRTVIYLTDKDESTIGKEIFSHEFSYFQGVDSIIETDEVHPQNADEHILPDEFIDDSTLLLSIDWLNKDRKRMVRYVLWDFIHGTYEVMESSSEERTYIQPDPAVWSKEQSMGETIPTLDYANSSYVIFHGSVGLFVYDLKEGKIIRSLDLEAIGCHNTKGASQCQSAVSTDGSKVYLRPADKDSMYVYDWTAPVSLSLFETEYQWPSEDEIFRTVGIAEISKEDTKYLGNEAVLFEQDGLVYFGYLYAEDGTLGKLYYVEDDAVNILFK